MRGHGGFRHAKPCRALWLPWLTLRPCWRCSYETNQSRPAPSAHPPRARCVGRCCYRLRKERCHYAKQVSRASFQQNQAIYVRGAMSQRSPSSNEELPARVQHDGRGELELQPVVAREVEMEHGYSGDRQSQRDRLRIGAASDRGTRARGPAVPSPGTSGRSPTISSI